MSTMNLTPVLRQRFFDHSTGAPLAGGSLYSYQAGTTTPQATYTDQGGGTPNANPVVLDSNGECSLWIDPSLSYKFVLKDSSGNTQWTVDNIIGLLTNNSVTTNSIQNGAVTTAKLAANSVTSTILASDASVDGNRAVTTNHLRDGILAVSAAGQAKMADGFLSADATGRGKMANGFTTAVKLGSSSYGGKLLHIRDEKSSGTSNGTVSNAAWTTRVLNTVVTDEIGTTLSSNTFTLPAGTFLIDARSPFYQCNNTKLRLYNVTDSASAMNGASCFSASTSGSSADATLKGQLTLAGTKTFRLDQYYTVDGGTNGQGVSTAISAVNEVYAEIIIRQVKE